MANQLYSHNSSYATASAGFLTSRSAADPYLPDSPFFGSSRLISASDYNPPAAAKPSASGLYPVTDRFHSLFPHSDGAVIGTFGIGRGTVASSGLPGSVAGGIVASAPAKDRVAPWLGIGDGVDFSGSKRSFEVLYDQPALHAPNTIGQSAAWLSTSTLDKRPRFENTSNFPICPQRPGEKMCTLYMLTRTCKFGDNCKFDHPIWVPDGGIPDYKEVPQIPQIPQVHESFPERPGQPDCPYFLKTQKCKFGPNCKFNHPRANQVTSGNIGDSALPERPSEPPCSFYLKTGRCKFGPNCKFHHPKDIHISSVGQGGKGEQTVSVNNRGPTGDVLQNKSLVQPSLIRHNSKGLPIRLGEVDCPFYMKTGSCKYGVSCRYNHPEHNAMMAPAAVLEQSIVTSAKIDQNVGLVNPAAAMLQVYGSRLANAALGLSAPVYPQRPGQIECDYYMKTGVCKFGESCRFHHPVDQSFAIPRQAQKPNVKLTLAGLPRREGAVHCPFYMKTGVCKYGVNCKFDHPTPSDVMAMSAKQVTSEPMKEGDKLDEAKVNTSLTKE